MLHFFYLTLLISCYLPQLSIAHSLNIKVALSPIGLFEITSDKLFGEIRYKSDKKQVSGIYEANRLSVKTTNLKTGIELRDVHLHKYLNSKKYSRVYMENIKIKDLNGTGLLAINGVKKKLKFKVQEKENELSTNFTIKLSDYNLKPKSFMGISTEKSAIVEIFVRKKDVLKK